MKSWYEMRAAAKDAAAQVLIYDEIGAWGISAKRFVTDLQALGAVSALDVRICSPGGDVFAGNAIYNALKAHPAAVTVHIDGVAASIASVIAMAGDTVVMPENAMLMIHNPWTIAAGDEGEMAKALEALRKIKPTLVAAYRAKTGLPDAEIAALMTAETWLTAEEAKAKGFADVVEGAVQLAARFDPARIPNAPAALVAALARGPAALPSPVATTGDPMSGTPNPTAEGQQPPAADTPPTPAASDPAAIARACLEGGFPELTASLIEAKASPDAVKARIEGARTIKDICAKARIPDQAAGLIAGGATVEAARAVAFEAMLARDAATQVDSAAPPKINAAGAGGRKPASVDPADIYNAFNNQGRKG